MTRQVALARTVGVQYVDLADVPAVLARSAERDLADRRRCGYERRGVSLVAEACGPECEDEQAQCENGFQLCSLGQRRTSAILPGLKRGPERADSLRVPVSLSVFPTPFGGAEAAARHLAPLCRLSVSLPNGWAGVRRTRPAMKTLPLSGMGERRLRMTVVLVRGENGWWPHTRSPGADWALVRPTF